jgi:hypothetical protein
MTRRSCWTSKNCEPATEATPPMEPRVGRPSFRRRWVSGRSPAIPTPVSTSSWSPTSPLPRMPLTRAPWCPGRRRFGRPKLLSAGQPSATIQNLATSHSSPMLVSTPSRSPRSPLSVLYFTQAPSCPEPHEFNAPGGSSCAWGTSVRP